LGERVAERKGVGAGADGGVTSLSNFRFFRGVEFGGRVEVVEEEAVFVVSEVVVGEGGVEGVTGVEGERGTEGELGVLGVICPELRFLGEGE
jgi:hypothetical protein